MSVVDENGVRTWEATEPKVHDPIPEGFDEDEIQGAIEEYADGDEHGDDVDDSELAQEMLEELNHDPLKPQGEESENAEDEEEGEGNEDPDGELVELKIDGETRQVTKDELMTLASKGGAFTQKMQALAHERREVEQLGEQVTQVAQTYSQALQAVHELIGHRLTPEERQAFKHDYVEVQRFQAARTAQERQRAVEEERALLHAAVPEWSDDGVAETEMRAMVDYAGELGYNEQDLANVIDHRAMVLLRKAMLYDQFTERADQLRDKVLAKKPLQPGARRRQGQPSSAKAKRAALDHLAANPSDDDAAIDALMHVLDED